MKSLDDGKTALTVVFYTIYEIDQNCKQSNAVMSFPLFISTTTTTS